MKPFPSFFAFCSVLAIVGATVSTTTAQTPTPLPADSLYDINVKTLDGESVSLSRYRGKVSLVVNLASKCGFTPQYKGLEALYEKYKDKGFVILGFPSNDFGGQEPGTPEEIQKFCSSTYGVTFPLFEKVVTHGAGQSPVYLFVTQVADVPKWNFTKYLVSKQGQTVAVFPSAVTPDNPALLGAIESELAKDAAK